MDQMKIMRTVEMQTCYESCDLDPYHKNGDFTGIEPVMKPRTRSKSPIGLDVEVSSSGSRSFERFKSNDESPFVKMEIL